MWRMYNFTKYAMILSVIGILAYYALLFVDHMSRPVPTKTMPVVSNYEIIDSTWSIEPGQLNTLQFDYLYYAKTQSGMKIRTSRLMNIGDTIFIKH